MNKIIIGKKKSTREEIGAKNIDITGVETYGNDYIVYFLIQPDNFDNNKIFYKERIEQEKSQKVRQLLEKDLSHLDRVQIQTASAREFLFIIRFKNYNPDLNDVQTGISRITKILKDEGFFYRLAVKEDIKRLYAVYFVQNITQVYFDDYDGERFVKGDNYN